MALMDLLMGRTYRPDGDWEVIMSETKTLSLEK